MIDEPWQITEGLNRRFPDGNEPFQIVTRLLVECGELAQQVNHFEGGGVKRQKYGQPDKQKLVKEIMDVLWAALQIALYYEARHELNDRSQLALTALMHEGYLSMGDRT